MRILLTILMALNGSLAVAGGTGVTDHPTTYTIPAPAASSGINHDASKGQSSQQMGQIMNGVAGAAMIAASDGCENVMLCVMGALALAQAAMMGKAAGQSGATYNASLNDGLPAPDGGPAPGPPPDYNPDNPTLPPGNPGAGPLNNLKTNGWTFSPGKVTTPDGKTYSSDDFKSKEAMENAGFSGAQASSAMAALGKINAKLDEQAKALLNNDAHVVTMGIDGGGGGGGGRSPASSDSLDDYLKKLRSPFGMNAKQKGDMVAGKSIAHGDDRIGVQVDDIFQMVARTYQANRDRAQFIEPAIVTQAVVKPTVAVKKK